MKIRELVPRRRPGLPPGQREIRGFPRFSDKPLRWAPSVNAVEVEITVRGERIAMLDTDALAGFPWIEQTSDFHCVTTWTRRGLCWGGVRLRDVVGSVVGDDLPGFALARSADRLAATYVTEDLLRDDVLLATHLDGAPLDRRHGAPLRLVSPGQYGYKNVKHVVGLEFVDDQPASMLGPKEHLRARVAFEERHATRPNWVVKIPYRLSIIPTALAAERGLRRSPD